MARTLLPPGAVSTASPVRDVSLRRNVLGGVVGNVLEWYDFAVFGYFAPVIGAQFFPTASRSASLLGAFGIFAGAYLMRPLGGVFFGNLGDRRGRKQALQLSVFMMAASTTAMALLPTYAQIGWMAPLLLVVCRLVQGLSVGGELIGSMSFITEIAPPGRRGLFGSFVVCSSTAGVMLGSAVAAGADRNLSPESLASWGWRLPFALGLGIGAFGLWMRRSLGESPSFERLQSEGNLSRQPIREALSTMRTQVCLVANLVMLSGVGFYVLFVWWPTYLTEFVTPPVERALALNTASMIVLVTCTPIAGWLSDVFGRRAVLSAASGALGLFAVPLFILASSGSPGAAFAAQLCFAVMMAAVSAPIPATIMELFPTRTRYSGAALGYNLSLAFFGGTAPLMATLLVSRTGSLVSPAYYLLFFAAVTLLACTGVHRFAPGDSLFSRNNAPRELAVAPGGWR